MASSSEEAAKTADKFGFPVVMKVVGPLHKSDVGGVILNIASGEHAAESFQSLMQIPGAEGVMIQPMIKGLELFAGVNHESNFGHMILCGLGGIFIEILKDFSAELSPVSRESAMSMILSLKSLPVIKGIRGKQGIDLEEFARILTRISSLLQVAPEIREMDINPLIGTPEGLFAVDARIRIEK
jgi:acetyltransferase